MKKLLELLRQANELRVNKNYSFHFQITDGGNISVIAVFNFEIEKEYPIGSLDDLGFTETQMQTFVSRLSMNKTKLSNLRNVLYGEDE